MIIKNICYPYSFYLNILNANVKIQNLRFISEFNTLFYYEYNIKSYINVMEEYFEVRNQV